MIADPTQCPHCGSQEHHTALMMDGRRHDPFKDKLWDKFRCVECGTEWKFTFIEVAHADPS